MMADIEKQIDYWRQGSMEDWEVAVKLVQDGKGRHGLFFAHLALEKILKAIICRRTRGVPPKIHNLSRLSELAGLQLDERLRPKEATEFIARSEEILIWLTQQL